MNDLQLHSSSKEEVTTLDTELASNARTPFSLYAARFSCYAPLSSLLLGPLPMQYLWLLGLCYLVYSVAFVLGIVGLIGGIQRKASKTIQLAAMGLFLSGFPFAIIAWNVLR